MNYAQIAVARRLALAACLVGTSYALVWASTLGMAERSLGAIRQMVILNYDLTYVQRMFVNAAFWINESWMGTYSGSALIFAGAFPVAIALLWRSRLLKRAFASLAAVALVCTFAFAAPLALGKWGMDYAAGKENAAGRASDGLVELLLGDRMWSVAGWVPHEWTGFENPMPHWDPSRFADGRKLIAGTVERGVLSGPGSEIEEPMAAVGSALAIGSLALTTLGLLWFGLNGAAPARRGSAKPPVATPT